MIGDLWAGLPVFVQDLGVTLAWLLPLIVVAALVLHGFRPLPLVTALVARFLWPTAMFVALIAISVGLGIGLVAQERALRQGTAQAADSFDLVIGAPGSEITLLLASVFLQPSDVPLVDGETYARVAAHEAVESAAPLAFGDSVDGAPVVGTVAYFVLDLSGALAAGRMWERPYEAVVGATSSAVIGDMLIPAHGIGDTVEDDAHAGVAYEVVGRMPPTGSPWDRAVLVPVEAVWQVHGLADGHAPENAGQIGPPFDARFFPGTPAVVVRAETLAANYGLRAEFSTDETMAFFPGGVLSSLYAILGDIRQAMSLMSLVTQGLVAASVLLGLIILSRLIRRQMALLRALGAPARFVFAVVWSFAALMLGLGAVLGVGIGWAAAAILSRIVTARTDVLVMAGLGWTEIQLAAAFLGLSSLAALIPAALMLRQQVVDSLRA